VGDAAADHFTVDDDVYRLAGRQATALGDDGVGVARVGGEDVGSDALVGDAAAVGSEPLEGHVAQLATVGQRHHRLGDALAEGLLADDHRAVVLLQGAGDDLGGRGRVGVDQHDHRQVVGGRIGGGEALGNAPGALEHDVTPRQ